MKEYNKVIFKKDSKQNIRFLAVETKKDILIQTSGIMGTSNPIEHTKVCKPKNIGKKNETSGNEQAYKEASALITDKLTKGYFKTYEEACSEEVILPMLAHDFKKQGHKIDWNKDEIFVQPKLDGQRVLVIKKNNKVILMSRDGKIITTLKHIENQFLNNKIPDNIYDGEIYNLELGGFQEQMSAFKKYIPGITEKMNINLYDIVLDLPFTERYKLLGEIFSEKMY